MPYCPASPRLSVELLVARCSSLGTWVAPKLFYRWASVSCLVSFFVRFVRDREDSRFVGIVILGAACLGSRSVLLIGGVPCEVSRARCSVVFERGCTWVSRVMSRVCVQVLLVLCRCVFLFERGLYLSVVLRLAHLTGRGRVIVIGVPAVWT